MRLQMQSQELCCAKCRGPFALREAGIGKDPGGARNEFGPCFVTQPNLCDLVFRCGL